MDRLPITPNLRRFLQGSGPRTHPTVPHYSNCQSFDPPITHTGHSVKNFTDVQYPETKILLPLFFIDINPKIIDSDIFAITSMLHTKVKNEEPYKESQIHITKSFIALIVPELTCVYQHKCINCRKTLLSQVNLANNKGSTIYKGLVCKDMYTLNKIS